jgi:uncharacterized Fe-S center protein
MIRSFLNENNRVPESLLPRTSYVRHCNGVLFTYEPPRKIEYAVLVFGIIDFIPQVYYLFEGNKAMQAEREAMKSKVFFVPVQESDGVSTVQSKLRDVLRKSGLLDCVRPNDKAVIKMHFGEQDNTGFVRPEYVRTIVDLIAEKKASATLSDTNTLYVGRRVRSDEHEKLAREHGFTKEDTGAPVMVPDERDAGNCTTVGINKTFIKEAKIMKLYRDADVLFGVAHFKGHLVTGFGGALKNIGMGCASREGKLAQHSTVSPVVYVQKCTGCGECASASVCPADAITIVKEKSTIDDTKCIGCASCLAACRFEAIDVNWGQGAGTLQEKMVEYAYAVLHHRKNNVFINVATKITAECDCLAKDDPRIVADVGILVSSDPVALDQASFDLVCQKANGKDVFKESHPKSDSRKQLGHAENLGLGTKKYELIM